MLIQHLSPRSSPATRPRTQTQPNRRRSSPLRSAPFGMLRWCWGPTSCCAARDRAGPSDAAAFLAPTRLGVLLRDPRSGFFFYLVLVLLLALLCFLCSRRGFKKRRSHLGVVGSARDRVSTGAELRSRCVVVCARTII